MKKCHILVYQYLQLIRGNTIHDIYFFQCCWILLHIINILIFQFILLFTGKNVHAILSVPLQFCQHKDLGVDGLRHYWIVMLMWAPMVKFFQWRRGELMLHLLLALWTKFTTLIGSVVHQRMNALLLWVSNGCLIRCKNIDFFLCINLKNLTLFSLRYIIPLRISYSSN